MGESGQWTEANANLERRKNEAVELNRAGVLGGFYRKLNNFEGDKIWIANEEAKRQEEVEKELPTILAEDTEIVSKHKGDR